MEVVEVVVAVKEEGTVVVVPFVGTANNGSIE